jgi:hypothetical protein
LATTLIPGLEAAFDADCTLRTVAVVVVADAGAEAFGHVFERLHGLWQAVEHPHAERRMLRRRQHGSRLRRQRKPAIANGVDQLRRGLIVRPLAHPPLVQSGSSG